MMPNEATLVGYAVLVVITLGSFVTVIIKFTEPINDLKVVIQELKDCIATLKDNNETQNKRLNEHGKDIDDLKGRVKSLETRMSIYHHE